MIIKNLNPEEVFSMKQQIDILKGQVVSKTLIQNEKVSITLFAFDKGEEISTHKSHGDAMVTVLEGSGRFTVDGIKYIVKSGETIVMPAEKPHAVFAEEEFKMLLTVVF